jgi:hypothetical protein
MLYVFSARGRARGTSANRKRLLQMTEFDTEFVGLPDDLWSDFDVFDANARLHEPNSTGLAEYPIYSPTIMFDLRALRR